jgi:septum formation topological specificity factor MinE
MSEEEIKERLVKVLVMLCPERRNTINFPTNTLEEHIEFLEVLAKYMMFDKEASCREAYESGKREK